MGDLGLSKIAANLMIHDLDFIEWSLDSPAPSAVWGASGATDGQALVHASFLQPGVSAQLIVSSQMPESYPFTVGYEAYFDQAKLVFHEIGYANGDIEASLTAYTSIGKESIPLTPNNPYEKAYAMHSNVCRTVRTPSFLCSMRRSPWKWRPN